MPRNRGGGGKMTRRIGRRGEGGRGSRLHAPTDPIDRPLQFSAHLMMGAARSDRVLLLLLSRRIISVCIHAAARGLLNAYMYVR